MENPFVDGIHRLEHLYVPSVLPLFLPARRNLFVFQQNRRFRHQTRHLKMYALQRLHRTVPNGHNPSQRPRMHPLRRLHKTLPLRRTQITASTQGAPPLVTGYPLQLPSTFSASIRRRRCSRPQLLFRFVMQLPHIHHPPQSLKYRLQNYALRISNPSRAGKRPKPKERRTQNIFFADVLRRHI